MMNAVDARTCADVMTADAEGSGQADEQQSATTNESQSRKPSSATIPSSVEDNNSKKQAAQARRKLSTSSSYNNNSSSSSNSRARSRIDNSVLCPRPFEAIYGEQAYLGFVLQWHASRTSELIERYCQVERDSLTAENQKRNRRQNRKLMHLLRCQMNYAVKQEQAVLLRLGELHLEAQSRETWIRARGRQLQMVTQRSHDASCTYRPSNSSSQLNGASPEFVPKTTTCQIAPESTTQEREDEAGVGDGLDNQGLEFAFEVLAKDRPVPIGSEQDDPAFTFAHRRLSLPNMQSIWPT